MTKYIVKNCPAYQNGKCLSPNSNHECCSKNDDCITKEIVFLVNADNYVMQELTKKEPYLNKQILEKLDIQEVE